MFDIGFPELLLVSIAALLVIGPDKLPETARAIMLWIGRVKNSFSSIKRELEQELGADEIRQQLHNESIMNSLEETRSQVDEVIKSAESAIKSDNLLKSPSSKGAQPQEHGYDESAG